MNDIADAMIPYLQASGISYYRNTPEMTAASSVRDSNARGVDLHLALHSNAAGVGNSGNVRGIDIYYYPGSVNGRRFADIIVNNLKTIYPLPDRVRALPTTAIGEVRRTNAPSVLAELGYHDNYEDATWIVNNTSAIAQQMSRSVAEYFGLPFVQPGGTTNATVNITSGSLNIRSAPSVTAPIIASATRGAPIQVLGRDGDWYQVNYNGMYGYAYANYILMNS